MTMIFLVILFIAQIISFYIIALLYMKVSKFNDLERKQHKLMEEMDDTLALYLAEIKDENERFIEKITKRDAAPVKKNEQIEQASVSVVMPQNTMRHHAKKSYEAVKQTSENTEVQLDDRSRAIQLAREGVSIEEIAKKLGKGKTEIELILKFN